jgi:hypothetical protein
MPAKARHDAGERARSGDADGSGRQPSVPTLAGLGINQDLTSRLSARAERRFKR